MRDLRFAGPLLFFFFVLSKPELPPPELPPDVPPVVDGPVDGPVVVGLLEVDGLEELDFDAGLVGLDDFAAGLLDFTVTVFVL